MSESQDQQPTKTSNILPWLRFWCNLVFCVLFLTSFIIAGCHLIKNTKPQGSKNIIKLIETIKENAKPAMIQHQAKDKPKVEQQPKDIPSSNSDSLETDKLPSNNIGNTTVESSKTDEHSECYTIRLDDFENALKAVAFASRQEAADDYHKSFSILVAILTVFGIGFPVIIALIQHSFNEKELDKIQDAIIQAENSTIQAENASTKAKDAINKTNKTIKQINSLSFDIYNEMIMIVSGLKNSYESQLEENRDNFSIIMIYLLSGRSLYYELKRYLLDKDIMSIKDIPKRLKEYLKLYDKYSELKLNELPINNQYLNNITNLQQNLNNTKKKLIEILNVVIENLKNSIPQEDENNFRKNLIKTSKKIDDDAKRIFIEVIEDMENEIRTSLIKDLAEYRDKIEKIFH